jgi:hypothetical protein
MLARLEAERRTVAVEAQSRAAQEKRIREEIEVFRRLEEQERPRVEAAILQRTQAEARLKQLREHLNEGAEDERSAKNPGAQYSNAPAELSAVERSRGNRLGHSVTLLTSEAATQSIKAAENIDSHGMVADYADRVDDNPGPTVPPSVLAYLNSVDPFKRAAAVTELARSHAPDAFDLIVKCFDDHSSHVQNAAARAVYTLDPNRSVEMFNQALEEGNEQRRRNIGAAIAASGLASEAINNLIGESREDTYDALAILFVMAKTGEVGPLLQALEVHRDDEVGQAVTRLLTLSGHSSA